MAMRGERSEKMRAKFPQPLDASRFKRIMARNLLLQMRYRHDGLPLPQAAARTGAATVLLAAVLYLVMGGIASADLGPARQAGLTTRAEIRDFQRSHGLVPDGVVGM